MQKVTTAASAALAGSGPYLSLLDGRSLVASAAAGFGAGLTALALYLATLAPDLTWANQSTDGGDLITAAHTLGIPHPPGYPLYVVAGKLFSLLPVGSVAFRFNLFSAVCMACGVGLLAAAIQRWPGRAVRPVAAAAAALLFGLIPLVWGQALVAEVYALNVALLGALFLALAARRPAAAGLFLGLAATGHATSVLMLPLALIATPRGQWSRLALGAVVGLAPLLLLPIFARGASPVVWGDARTVAGWWSLVSAEIYRGNLGHWPGAAHWAEMREALRGGLGLPALVAASFVLAGRALKTATRGSSDRRLAAVLVGTAAAYALFALLYDTPDAAVLLLPGLMALAVVIAPALDGLGTASLIAPALIALLSFGRMDLRGDAQPRALAETLLAQLPERAIVLTPGDRTIFTLWYFQHVEGQRPDLVLVDRNLFAFDWYRSRLAERYPDLAALAADDLAAFARENAAARPFCAAGLLAATDLPDPLTGNTTSSSEAPFLTCTD